MTNRGLPGVVVAAAVVACGPQREVEVVRVDVKPTPASVAHLPVQSDEPLSLATVLPVDAATVVVADRASNDVWLFDTSAREMRLRRLLSADARLRAKLVAISRTADGWRLLDRTGSVYRFDHDWQSLGVSQLRFGRGTIVSAAADANGAFGMLLRRPAPGRTGGLEHALMLADAAGEVREAWRSAADAAAESQQHDMLSLSRTAGGWLLSGSDPPRALHFDATGVLERRVAFETTARRPFVGEPLKQFERMVSAAGLAGKVRPPSRYPPITALRQVASAYLAVPITGGTTGEAEGLDVYCSGRYRRTLFDAPALAQVVLADEHVILLWETDTSYRMEQYRVKDLPITCEEST